MPVSPKQGVSAANKVVGEGTPLRRRPGHLGSCHPGFDVLAENGVLMVTPTGHGA